MALGFIAELIPKLDTMKMESKRPSLYSMPSETQFYCDRGKTYHFWLTAYLTRKLRMEGFSAEASGAAAFITEMGYQATRGSAFTIGGKPFDYNDNSSRMDMTLASAGVKYGRDQASGIRSAGFDINGGYVRALESSDAQASGNGVISWLLHFAPEDIYSFFE